MSRIISGVGSPGSIGAASGGKVYAYNNLSTTPAVVAPANTARTRLTFHNPHATIDIYVAPSLVLNAAGSSVALVPTTSALGGTFRVFAGGTLTIEGECSGSWQAFSASSSSIPLTVMDSNV